MSTDQTYSGSFPLLQKLQNEIPLAQLLGVVQRDGTVLEISHNDPVSSTLVSLIAALYGAIGESLRQGGLEPLQRCLWETARGTIIIEGAGDLLLVAIVDHPSAIGLHG